MDEFGSALRHSDEPNFRVAPFLFMPECNLASAVRFSSIFFFLDLCYDVEVAIS
jgi:tubulin--tyrosine ligase-like protein 12